MIERLFESETTRWLLTDTDGAPRFALLVTGKAQDVSNEKEDP